MITFCSSLPVTVTNLTVLGIDSVSKEPGLTSLAAISSGVVQTQLTQSSNSVTGLMICHVNVSIALTGLTEAIISIWFSKISWTTSLASVSNIVWFTFTELVFSRVREQAIT